MLRSKVSLTVICLLMAGLAGWAEQAAKTPAMQKLPNGDYQLEGITVRVAKGELAIPARFVLKEGALEVIVARPEGRLHEALLVTREKAVFIQAGLYLLKARNGSRSMDKPPLRQGTLVDMDVEWKDDGGKARRDPVEAWITDTRTHQVMKRIGWVFVGSGIHQGKFLADAEGNIAINWSQGATILDSPDPASEDDTLHQVNVAMRQPKLHPDVTLVLKPRTMSARR